MSLTSSLSINGFPGTGKTYATAKIVSMLGLKAVVLDFEGKYQKTVDLYFSDFTSQFEVYKVTQKAVKSQTGPRIRAGSKVIQADMKMTFKGAPDYLASFNYLTDIFNEIIERSDYQVLIMDGATPIIRNNLGLAYWKSLHIDRAQPEPVEWGAMNDVEQAFIDAGIGWAEETGGLFIVTGQMKEEYKKNVKVGDIPGISMKCRHSIDVVLELQKNMYRDHTDYLCVCCDSIKEPWVEPVTLDRHVLEILTEKDLLSY